ncbi:hypothetical protein EVB87_018 [Rhizobium phage RHph_N28_1]|nr:hypothetical protein EVB87_018 [Rhizobium phage RHph_N28_1]QIG74046.1 hypothetical protein EVC07_018 [Rhizobium phage RHph_N42]QXV73705.1 hypothetical protein [Rhizobium phage RHph_N46]
MDWTNFLTGRRYTNAKTLLLKHPEAFDDVNFLTKRYIINVTRRAPIWIILFVPLLVLAGIRLVNIGLLWLTETADNYMADAFEWLADLPYRIRSTYYDEQIDAANARLDALQKKDMDRG